MKAEIKEILDYVEGREEILRLRDQMKNLESQDSAALQATLDYLLRLLEENEIENAGNAGQYHLFLGCGYHAQQNYAQASFHLKKALVTLKGSKNNKAVAHWLLSMNYAGLKDFEKARKELIKAEKLSTARVNAMQHRIDSKINDMFNDPIFALVPPIPKPQAPKSAAAGEPIPETSQPATEIIKP